MEAKKGVVYYGILGMCVRLELVSPVYTTV
jgi:hypothetical protein